MTDLINLVSIGIVHNDYINPNEAQIGSRKSTIEIFSEYTDALLRVTEHSHIWVIGWFHEAKRDVLRVIPRMNKDLPEYGVFGLRTFSRPNPIGLTPVKLVRISDNLLYVEGLDFIDGTPVIDIKPYYERDIIFSPDTPYIKPKSAAVLEEIMLRDALNHHQEECPQLLLGVKMCMAAEKELGNITSKDLKVTIQGSRCLADTIQGITKARLANPCRMLYNETPQNSETKWEKGNKTVTVTLKETRDLKGIKGIPYENLFNIEVIDLSER